MHTATATANPNIAFIKYWGNRDQVLRLPASGSISMNLAGLETTTTVTFDSQLAADRLTINGQTPGAPAQARVVEILNLVRTMASIRTKARVESANNFPTGAGIASSASAFAALALAAAKAAGLDLSEMDLSRLARRGSGSACRSIPGGFVEWLPGESDLDSYARTIAPAGHWDLVDCVAVISRIHKPTGSTEGHAAAVTSPLQAGRLDDAPRRLDRCRRAILERDFEALAGISELDSNLMHAVMMTSSPPLLYWEPATLGIMLEVKSWRSQGLPAFYTIDAGPNVHVLCPTAYQGEVQRRLRDTPGVLDVLVASPGGPAKLVEQERQDV